MPVCPQCNHPFSTHPEVCHFNNSRTYANNKIKSIGKQDAGHGKYQVRKETYQRIQELVSQLLPGETISTTKILGEFGTLKHSTGDVYQNVLDLLVCRGILSKKFNPKGHTYTKNSTVAQCPYLNVKTNKNNQAILSCSFDWKESERLDFTSEDFVKE